MYALVSCGQTFFFFLVGAPKTKEKVLATQDYVKGSNLCPNIHNLSDLANGGPAWWGLLHSSVFYILC